ncbi:MULTISPECIES: chemotaxis protein CheA [Bradyrhizobium]|uniref:Chemotaxis protein CheA n=1 Tax=Bradyrhizobium ottawaense TaxID=931866 RepID=A0A2U8P088_9BRAD|nr:MULTISPECIES: chemotaxis protein CheA [Bradyrhizobium]AWL91094.1 chemotaxis protein CheA [Bradyrhizobium ottawaense]MBR1292505.1 chemotaxis protein CheA [Bradyrhizobium ottawaense]MBR1329107.1 chemotaxis protein CheA [Bradyrhizobium ottawaense]MBR1335160.1 chemotaxis protein CheA [Bradyrhizobium ottawaense]MDA9483975.1 chemotaxis protein CheA [Bradyrhizobium sp. CCBAU 11445]
MSAMDPTEVFRQEASELFEVLEGALLDLGQRPDDRELVDSAFRALHTIKGSGAMFGFDKVASFTHEFETAFDRVRKGEIKPTQELISVALAAKDYIRALIEDPQSTDDIIGEAILDDLKRFVSADQPGAAVMEIAEAPPLAPAGSNQAGWHLYLEFETHILRNGSNPLDLLEDLCKLGPCFVVPVTDGVPFLDEMEPEDCYLKWDVKLHAACDKDAIDDVFMFVQDEMKLTLSPLEHVEAPAPAPLFQLLDEELAPVVEMPAPPVEAAAAPVAEQLVAKAEPKSESKPEPKLEAKRDDRGIATVRVQAERLDELMDRVGELVIAQARLTQLAASGSDLSIKMIAEEIERLASSLRDTTMGARMVPIGSLFGRFRRLVHDLSRDLSKPVEFVTSGEDTELDKTMIECLADPLVHLIRNAVDHGIEDTATRAANGKTEQGRIELAAVHSGAQVLVTVKDNGGGLNTARIRAKAEEQGLIATGAVLTDHEIHQFLFHPGFSTAQTISALSGRGVGMDVVKRTIENMRGSIDLSTRPGQGTTVTLRLPLTLAIIEGLLIRVGEGRYIIPLSAVEECIELTAEDERSRGRNFLNVRGNLVPFLRLREIMTASGTPDRHQKTIIISTGETHVGLVADQIIGNHQTVIKSLSKLHSDVTMFSGATILGDGTAALILDVAQLVALAQSKVEKQHISEAA